MQFFSSLLLVALLPPASARYQQSCHCRADVGAGFTPTADAQRAVDAGYDMDRGPAAFHALRLHWEV